MFRKSFRTSSVPSSGKVHDMIVSTRQGGEIRGPFAIWIRNAELAAAANQMGNAVRLNGKLDARLFELIILVVARHWSAQYEWFAHAKDAAKVGLDAQDRRSDPHPPRTVLHQSAGDAWSMR